MGLITRNDFRPSIIDPGEKAPAVPLVAPSLTFDMEAETLTVLLSEAGEGRTTIALETTARAIADGRPVLYVCGDEPPAVLTERLVALGVEPAASRHLWMLPARTLEQALGHAGGRPYDLVVIDDVPVLERDVELAITLMRSAMLRLGGRTILATFRVPRLLGFRPGGAYSPYRGAHTVVATSRRDGAHVIF